MTLKIALPVFEAGQYVCVASGKVVADRNGGFYVITSPLVRPRRRGWIMQIANVEPHPTLVGTQCLFFSDTRLEDGSYNSIWFEHALNQPPPS